MSCQNSRLGDQPADTCQFPEIHAAYRSLANDSLGNGSFGRKHLVGISLVEMMVAVALLSIISIAALQLVRTTETDIVGSQVTMGNQQKK